MKLDMTNVKSALVSTVLMAVLAVLVYVLGIGDVFLIKSHEITNIVVMSVATGLVSLIKSLLTGQDGKFAGVTQVK